MKISGSTGYYRSLPAAFVRVFGPDAPAFLQGQFTNDLRQFGVGEGSYGLWLTHKGKVLADSVIIKSAAEEYFIFSRDTPASVLQKRLEDFIIADDVSVEDVTGDWELVTLVGPEAEAWLRTEPRPGFLVRARITRADSFDWIFPKADGNSVGALLERARRLTAVDLERLRIQAGVASVPRDIGPNDLPNEGGLDVEAVSYDKGCYLGQEVMARLKSKGRIRRSLLKVTGEGSIPPLPAALFQEGKQVGELRSAASLPDSGFVGLALVTTASLNPSLHLSLQGAGSTEIRLAPESA